MTDIKKTPIPQRLKNVSADHPYVAGAIDIVDDSTGNNQQAINANTYRKGEVYSKEETNNIISRTPETDVIILDVPTGSTALDVLNTIPVADRPNKLFRVRNNDNTAYSEYGWTGSSWSVLANKDYGIDDEPIDESSNLINSGGVAKLISDGQYMPSVGVVFTGQGGTVFAELGNENKFYNKTIAVELEASDINTVGLKAQSVVSDLYGGLEEEGDYFTKFVIVDAFNCVIAAFNGDFKDIGVEESSQEDFGNDDLYKRFERYEGILHTACRFNPSEGFKYLQLLLATDTHEQDSMVEHQNILASDFETIDASIHLGDFVNGGPRANISAKMSHFYNITKNTKPRFLAIGNHESGTYSLDVAGCMERDELYNVCIKPMVDNGFLKEGEYTENKCYYYHDFDYFKNPVRLIVLDAFDYGSTFCTDYWEPVEYQSGLPLIVKGTYESGFVGNVQNYSKYSFRAVQNVNVDHVGENGYSCQYAPRYNEYKQYGWYSEEQLLWFANALKWAAENGYIALVAGHYGCASEYTVLTESDFSPSATTATPAGSSLGRLSPNNRDIISEIISACKEKIQINKHIEAVNAISKHFANDDVTLSENIDSFESFDFSYDFSEVENDLKALYLSGHTHRDSVGITNDGILAIGFDRGKRDNGGRDDTFFSSSKDNAAYDALNAITLTEDAIHICKMGNDYAYKIKDHKLVSRSNVFIDYNNE